MKKLILLLSTVIASYQADAQCNFNYQINGLSVTFVITQLGLSQPYQGIKWDYGDGLFSYGTVEAGDTVTHVYSSIGNYEVCIIGFPMYYMNPTDTGCNIVDILSSGIIQTEQNSIMVIYPNPASELITLKANRNHLGSNYLITDQLGAIVLSGKLTNETNDININDLAIGVYVLRVGEQSFKIMKK